MDSLYATWLSQNTPDGQDTPSSSVSPEWKPSSTSALSASTSVTVGQPALEVSEFSLGGGDLPAAPASSPPIPSQTSGFFSFTQQPHGFWTSSTYNAVPYAATPWTGAQSTQLPLSSYSSLNGATSSSSGQHLPNIPNGSQMVIDPTLTTMNGSTSRLSTYSTGSYLPPQPQQRLQFPYQQPSHSPPLSINPSFVHTTPSHFQHLHLHRLASSPSQSSPQGTLSPYVLQSTSEHDSSASTAPVPASSFYAVPTAAPSAPRPSAEERKEGFLVNLKPYLQPASFTGAGAVAHLTELIEEYGTQDVDVQVRLEITTKIRDNAGNHYFRAWLENALAMEVTQEWLRMACVGKDDSQLLETIMPLLQILDRLPMSVDSLRNNKLGKIVVKLVRESPTSAIKDMASNLERKWRGIIAAQNKEVSKDMDNELTEDTAGKKRKAEPVAAKAAPPAKRGAVAPTSSTKPLVKKEPKLLAKEVKDAKSDSSFFSAPKPKPKLPSFKKAPIPVVKKESDSNVAQPSSIDPFQEALKSMAPKARKDSPMSLTPPSVSLANPPPAISKPNRKGKSVSWAPDGQLEMVKIIERAVYDDDPEDGAHVSHSLRDLDRGEGAALHAHLFEEQTDWVEPQPIETPSDLDILEKGKDSLEKGAQEEREQTALVALYMSAAHIPESPAEPSSLLPDEEVDQDVRKMLTGPDADAVFWNGETHTTPEFNTPMAASVADLVGQLSGDVIMGDSFGGQQQSFNLDPSALSSMPGLSNIAAPEQLQEMMQRAQTALLQSSSFSSTIQGPDQPWHVNAYTEYERGISDEGGRDRRWTGEDSWSERGARGRGRGRGRGRDGFRQTRRKPCSFFAQGRCKYGDQCDFSHEPIHH